MTSLFGAVGSQRSAEGSRRGSEGSPFGAEGSPKGAEVPPFGAEGSPKGLVVSRNGAREAQNRVDDRTASGQGRGWAFYRQAGRGAARRKWPVAGDRGATRGRSFEGRTGLVIDRFENRLCVSLPVPECISTLIQLAGAPTETYTPAGDAGESQSNHADQGMH